MYVIFSEHCRSFPQLLCCSLLKLRRYLAYLLAPMKLLLSCRSDIEEEVVAELDDNPGTTNRAKFSNLQKV